jgi:hypothetical protein
MNDTKPRLAVKAAAKIGIIVGSSTGSAESPLLRARRQGQRGEDCRTAR